MTGHNQYENGDELRSMERKSKETRGQLATQTTTERRRKNNWFEAPNETRECRRWSKYRDTFEVNIPNSQFRKVSHSNRSKYVSCQIVGRIFYPRRFVLWYNEWVVWNLIMWSVVGCRHSVERKKENLWRYIERLGRIDCDAGMLEPSMNSWSAFW